MKNLIALAALISLAASAASAQTFGDMLQEEMAKQLAGKKAPAAQKAAAPKAKADRKAIQTLVDRLDKDGEDGATEDGWEAKSYILNGSPDKSGSFSNFSVSLIEKELPPPTAGDNEMITYTVMRKVLSHIQGAMQTYTPMPQGKAKVEMWEYAVSLDGEITTAVKTTMIGKVVAPGTIDIDPKDPQGRVQQNLVPSAAKTLETWKTMEKKFLTMGRLIEA